MRINIPLLPFLIDVRWRPLRPFQCRMRGMMLAVGVAGLVCSLGAYAIRLVEMGNDHASRYAYNPTGLNSGWHAMMAQRYQHAGWILSLAFWVSLMTLTALGMAATLGRILDSLHRRSVLTSQE
jgi:hypothetical protein